MRTKTIGLAALGLLGVLSLGGCAADVGYGYGDPYGPGIYNEGYGLGFGYDYGFDPYHHHGRFDGDRGRGYGRYGGDRFDRGRRLGPGDRLGDRSGLRRGRIIIPRYGRGGFGPDRGGFGGGRGGLGSGSSKG